MLPTFPSRYWSTIGLSGVFSLAGWAPLLLTGFLVSRHTQGSHYDSSLACTGVSPSSPEFPNSFQFNPSLLCETLLPRPCRNTPGLGSAPFARHYSGYRCFFLFLQVLRCFSSLRSPRRYRRCRAFSPTGCPIRISPDLYLFAVPRSFSQLTTSFFASESLGIHLTLLLPSFLAILISVHLPMYAEKLLAFEIVFLLSDLFLFCSDRRPSSLSARLSSVIYSSKLPPLSA